jgi:predicted DCC family thiol-disulfide oxidoreductase YuxK
MRVVVFDTTCLLCSKFIQILLSQTRGQLHFTGFESEFSKQYLPENLLDAPETVVFYNQGQLSTKSNAVLSILKFTGWSYRWLRVFRILPQVILDRLYDWVARNRYSWFGQSETCFMPAQKDKEMFLE